MQEKSYSLNTLLPPIKTEYYSGPLGPAYVQVFDDGTTQPGWGGKTFIENYKKQRFSDRRATVMFGKKQTPFALVMRSVALVCLDIDGKNGGFESAKALNLPATLAETSKSGNGYHLFYRVDDVWNVTFGFDRLRDRIGWRTGIDVRATGCVFHYPTQRWNKREPMDLPEHILLDLESTRDDLQMRTAHIQSLQQSTDPDERMEFLMLQTSIASKLTAPIPAGSRNNTLFAIGAEMKTASILGWEEQVHDRAVEVGLTTDEAEKLVKNIERYA